MGLDLNFDYQKAKDQITATKRYEELKETYDKVVKEGTNFFDDTKSDVTQTINGARNEVKRFQKEIKTQFEQLLELGKATGGKSSGSLIYIKRLMLQALKNSGPKLKKILFDEAINSLGCDQQQAFSGSVVYIKVSSIDLSSLLLIDPSSDAGKIIYERLPVQHGTIPFSMNKLLYQLTQVTPTSYSALTGGFLYKGASGQDLFDIKYLELHPITGQLGPWFEVNLVNRVSLSNANKVGEFMLDYYETIEIADFTNVMAQIMNSLTGAISFSVSAGVSQSTNRFTFETFIQRILGLCFDTDQEINTSGIAKVGELDDIDDSFFELTEIDLRNLDSKLNNLRLGVIEYRDCNDAKLPLDISGILESLNNLNFVPDDDLVEAANNLTDNLVNNAQANGVGLEIGIEGKVNLDFLKALPQGLVVATLSPKVLLPIFIMGKALGDATLDAINSFKLFCKSFKKFVINIVSKFGAIFVQELFDLIVEDIKRLLQGVITNILNEKLKKLSTIILKLIQILLILANLISDWRKCKSVIDEILSLLKLVTPGIEIPLPILFAAQLLDGYSESRAFVGVIQEMQKLGIPTGDMPSGAPNLQMLSMFGQMKAMNNEESENGKLQVAIPPLTITPSGLSVPSSAFGKKI